MKKHFKYAMEDAIDYKQTVIVGLYKVKYQTEDEKIKLELFDTDFHIGSVVFIPQTNYMDIKLKITTKQWQIDIIKSIFKI